MEKKKKISIIVLVITLILIITISTTALWKWTSGNSNVGFTISGLDAYIIYNKGSDVLTGVLDPVSSYSQTGVSTEITLYKNTSKTLYGHIYLDVTAIGTNIATEPAVKWVITSNGEVLNEGNFVGSSVGDSIPLKINIPLSTTEQKFQIYIWLDESMDINDAIEGETLSTIVRAEASEVEYEIEPNSPDLVQGLVPITYSNNKWVKADSTNANNSWYNYSNKQWANAVLVTSDYRDANNKDTFNVGDEVPEDAILAYYVWIPRYKYKVWNITKTVGTDSYNAQTTGIDIVFEKGTKTTGTITCNNYSFAFPTSTTPNETCSGANGEYYTHPAFWWDENGNGTREASEEVRGFWVGKFEISAPSESTCYSSASSTNCRNTTLAVRTKPNVNSWRYNYLTNFNYVIQNMQADSNEYGLTTDRTKADSHMLKNMEWGAVAYLTNSDYGRCSDGTCTEVSINSYYVSAATGYKTGCGPQSAASTSSGSTCHGYNSELGQLASTTGNVYGIYDMSGGAYEYVMGNMSSAAGGYTYYASSGGSNFTYSEDTAKYINTYAYYNSSSNRTSYNRSRLGDATGEVVLSTGGGGGWYSDYAFFVYPGYSWFIRGGDYSDGANAGVFIFSSYSGSSDDYHSARVALLAL